MTGQSKKKLEMQAKDKKYQRTFSMNCESASIKKSLKVLRSLHSTSAVSVLNSSTRPTNACVLSPTDAENFFSASRSFWSEPNVHWWTSRSNSFTVAVAVAVAVAVVAISIVICLFQQKRKKLLQAYAQTPEIVPESLWPEIPPTMS